MQDSFCCDLYIAVAGRLIEFVPSASRRAPVPSEGAGSWLAKERPVK